MSREVAATRRAIAKIAFNYVTKRLGVNFALNKGFDKVREHIRLEKHMDRRFVRRIPKLPIDYGERDASERHGHYVAADWEKNSSSVIGWVSLFQLSYFEINFGSFSGVVPPRIAVGRYFDIISKSILELQTYPRPQGLLVPSVIRVLP